MSDILNALIVSLLAGLATGLGGLIVLVRRPSKKMMSFLMGLAAGVMIILSFLNQCNCPFAGYIFLNGLRLKFDFVT